MDYDRFYKRLFQPIEDQVGAIDADTIMAIVGFDFGGPVSLCTVGYGSGAEFTTYVSCELAVREEQVPSEHGRYELLCHSDDEEWASSVLTSLGQMSHEVGLDDGHTIEVSEIVGPHSHLTGVALERFATVEIDGSEYSILRVHGLTSSELAAARELGSDEILARRKAAGVYPNSRSRKEPNQPVQTRPTSRPV